MQPGRVLSTPRPESPALQRRPGSLGRTLLKLVFALACVDARAAVIEDAAVGERVSVPGFRYAAGKRLSARVVLRRIDVYAPGAQIVAPGAGAPVPQSRLRLFVNDPAHTATRLYLAVDPARHTFSGAVFADDDTHAIAGRIGTSALLVDRSKALRRQPVESACAGSPHPLSIPGVAAPRSHATAGSPATKGAMRIVVVAVDTDNELMQTKFGNDTGRATDYLAELFAAINAMYRNDLDVQLVQGTTFLRVGSTPDPYTTSSASAVHSQLIEFGTHWRNNLLYTAPDGTPVVARTLAAMLSGKSPGGTVSTGIAWLLDDGNYCASTGVMQDGATYGHYSVTRVFRFAGAVASDDAALVAHELGHSLGASHTHCSSASTGAGTFASGTIDVCHNGEAASGCYAGPTACPADTLNPPRGSIMSYCHLANSGGLLSDGSCGAPLLELHPAHQVFLASRVQANVDAGCIGTAAPANADLSVAKTSADSDALPGGTVAYAITVANAGPQPATGVQLFDPAPAGLAFVSASGGCTSFPCALGTLASGAQVVVTANYTVDAGAAAGTIITNTALATSTSNDPATANNSDDHVIAVTPAGRVFRSGFE